MKFEVIKTYVLVILVGLSLILSYSIWNYQPNYELLSDTDYLDEIDIGGKEQSKKDVIKPTSIIFKNAGQYYGFTNPTADHSLFKDMQSWMMYNFQTSEINHKQNHDYEVEIIFPDALPMEILPDLFTLPEEVELPSWSFQRLYVTFDTKQAVLNVQFISMDGRYQATALINDTSKYDLLWKHVTNQNELSEYIVFNEQHTPIYLPKDEIKMIQRSFTTESIDSNKLVNALFSNPSSVRANISGAEEAYYTDGQRQMRVYSNRKIMEFVNPYETAYDPMDAVDLLTRSTMNLNEYKGWTNDFYLDSVDTTMNKICFRMNYENIPVYNQNHGTVIEQEWRNQELFKYIRPLFMIKDSLGSNEITLESGMDVMRFLENSPNYELENIEDVQMGYQLSFQDNSLNVVTLKPAWFVKYMNTWQEINMEDPVHDDEKGVS
ncbi:MAG TPA: two-component system activity regulator YycH [Bacillota bacterium]|nr:two-component system activity regulator YycH [Bacillota bacterium]